MIDVFEVVGLGIWVGAGVRVGWWSDELGLLLLLVLLLLWFVVDEEDEDAIVVVVAVCGCGWIGGGKFRFAAAIISPSSKSSCPHAFAPGIFDNTLDRSTPVKAFIAGGSWPTNLVTSPVIWSEPLIRTISSVLANGAETSAAI